MKREVFETVKSGTTLGRPVKGTFAWPVGMWLLLVIAGCCVASLAAHARVPPREQAIRIVAQIQRADYEGDRAALKRLSTELTPLEQDPEISARIKYWRGFALWRRAINGFNDSADPQEIGADLEAALDEFHQAAKSDASFVEPKIAAVSCVSILAFSIEQGDSARQKELIAEGQLLVQDLQAAAPDNPRFLWVLGPNLWYARDGGGPAKAIDAYNRGLAALRLNKDRPKNALDPSWGEPELLMSLAWSSLNRSPKDVGAAEKYAKSALGLVPYWHYVKDILLPQIEAVKRISG